MHMSKKTEIMSISVMNNKKQFLQLAPDLFGDAKMENG